MARDYRSEFKGKCLTCIKYDIYSRGDVTVRGYRCTRLMRQVAMDEHCYQHDFDPLRSNSTIDAAVQYIKNRGYDPRPDCYVTTACCKILGLGYDHEYIINFRRLKDEYMATFPEGKRQLNAYDIYGVQIAEKIKSAYENPETREGIVTAVKDVFIPCYLEPVGRMVKSGNFEMAMYTYFRMIQMLAERYGIEYTVEQINTEVLNQDCGRKLSTEGA